MKFLRGLIVAGLASATLLAGVATASKLGAQSIEHPEGLSLRDESVRGPRGRGFFLFYAGRSHRGGGPRSFK